MHPAEAFVVWQHERAGRDHLQGYVEFKSPQPLSSLQAWLPGSHFEPRGGSRQQAIDYCRKEDTRVAGPWTRGQEPVGAGKRSDLEDVKAAIRSGASKRQLMDDHAEVFAKYPRFVDAYCASVRLEKVTLIITIVPRFSWQQRVLDVIDGPVDPRTIYWVFDAFGNHGKTYLATYLTDSKDAFYSNGGKATDITYAYTGQPICIFDYVRDSAEYVNYGVIEQLKNGILFSPKYESGLKRFPVPHVFVFANFRPAADKFSVDRLVTFELNSIGQII